MKEANIQTLFGKYIKENPPGETEVYELKLCKGKSLPFDSVKEHQIKGLLDANKGLYHKISDSPIFAGNKMRFTKPKPFDCLYIKTNYAYVAILYYKPRQKKELLLIDIGHFIKEKDMSDRKSLTEERAKEIATMVIIL